MIYHPSHLDLLQSHKEQGERTERRVLISSIRLSFFKPLIFPANKTYTSYLGRIGLMIEASIISNCKFY